MSAVMIHPKTYIPLGVLGLIAAAFAIWLAFFLRDPDPVLVPSNTESLILMPDGRPLLVRAMRSPSRSGTDVLPRVPALYGCPFGPDKTQKRRQPPE